MPTAERRKAAEAKAKAAEEAAEEEKKAQEEADAAKALELAGAGAEKKPPVDMNEVELYVNKSRNNIYTENGRCMPDQKIQLPPALAKKYVGLESCQD